MAKKEYTPAYYTIKVPRQKVREKAQELETLAERYWNSWVAKLAELIGEGELDALNTVVGADISPEEVHDLTISDIENEISNFLNSYKLFISLYDRTDEDADVTFISFPVFQASQAYLEYLTHPDRYVSVIPMPEEVLIRFSVLPSSENLLRQLMHILS